MRDVWEALQQFRRDHPEYDEDPDALRIAQEALETAQRIQTSEEPTYLYYAGSTARPVTYQYCPDCSGYGIVGNGGYYSVCQGCWGAGGWCIQ